MDDGPTESLYTNEWYRKQFQRQEHLSKILHAELVDYMQQCRTMRKELNEAIKQRLEDAATIGQTLSEIESLREKVTQAETRINKASDVVASLRSELNGRAK